MSQVRSNSAESEHVGTQNAEETPRITDLSDEALDDLISRADSSSLRGWDRG